MKILITILFLCSVCSGVSSSIESFTSGQVTPLLEGRADFQKYNSANRTLENVFVWPQGPVTRRPGTRFIASTSPYRAYPLLRDVNETDSPDSPGCPDETALSSPTEISNFAEMESISGSNHYIFTADINCAGETWTKIADFNGVIDACDYTISNLTITAISKEDDVGMFSNLGNAAEIRNLNFKDCTVYSGTSYCDSYGILVGQINGKHSIYLKNIDFESCTIDHNDAGTLSLAGSLIGYIHDSNVKICDCDVNNPNIEGNLTNYWDSWELGGLIGDIDLEGDGKVVYIINCTVTGGNINAYGEVGGLIGNATIGGYHDDFSNSSIKIFDSSSSALINVGGMSGGGFIGYGPAVRGFGHTVYIVDCCSTGDVNFVSVDTDTSGQNIGGFGGYVAIIEDSNNVFVIDDCYATGNVTHNTQGDAEFISGFITHISNDTTLSSGVNNMLSITDCYSTGNVTVTVDDPPLSEYPIEYVAGFAAYVKGGDASRTEFFQEWQTAHANEIDHGYYDNGVTYLCRCCHDDCEPEDMVPVVLGIDANGTTVYCDGQCYLVPGWPLDWDWVSTGWGNLVRVKNCYSTGDITLTTGYDDIFINGGFIAEAEGYVVLDGCYSTGDITATIEDGNDAEGGDESYIGYIGGFAGLLNNTITYRCMSRGNVSCVNNSYELAGNDAGWIQNIGGFVASANPENQADANSMFFIQDCYSWGDIVCEVNAPNDTCDYGTITWVGGFTSAIANKRGFGDEVTGAALRNVYSIGGLSLTTTKGTGISSYGGLIGDNSNFYPIEISYCYWDTEASGESSSDGGEGYRTDPMQWRGHPDTYTYWDFNAVWYLPDPTFFRLIPFEYSTGDSYVLGWGHENLGFFRTVK